MNGETQRKNGRTKNQEYKGLPACDLKMRCDIRKQSKEQDASPRLLSSSLAPHKNNNEQDVSPSILAGMTHAYFLLVRG